MHKLNSFFTLPIHKKNITQGFGHELSIDTFSESVNCSDVACEVISTSSFSVVLHPSFSRDLPFGSGYVTADHRRCKGGQSGHMTADHRRWRGGCNGRSCDKDGFNTMPSDRASYAAIHSL